MISRLIIVCVFSIVFYLITLLINNKDSILSCINKLNKNIKKTFEVLLYIIIFVTVVYFLYNSIIFLKDSIDMFKEADRNNKIIEESTKKINEEIEYYNKVISQDYDYNKSKSPYIPEGFSYVEGQWNTGYVIEDDKSNQYVWIPCSNIETDGIIKLDRIDFDIEKIIPVIDCYDEEYKDFLNSALNNGGFYISRYEMGMENNALISQPKKEVLCDITRDEAVELSKNMYTTIKSSLINSFAYDTTLKWIKQIGEIQIDKTIVLKDEKLLSGRKQIGNIFDFTDNHLEYTLETCYDTLVIRGYSYEKSIENRSRYNIRIQDTDLDSNSKVVIRTILYK